MHTLVPFEKPHSRARRHTVAGLGCFCCFYGFEKPHSRARRHTRSCLFEKPRPHAGPSSGRARFCAIAGARGVVNVGQHRWTWSSRCPR
nr:MAG: hypothetical protein DIU78_08310 [Pseudomonadota bacterium]